MRICWGCSTSLFTVLYFKQSAKKHRLAKIFQGIWESYLLENNRNYNFYRFSVKFYLIPIFPFRINQKRESYFRQVCGLAMKHIFVLRYCKFEPKFKLWWCRSQDLFVSQNYRRSWTASFFAYFLHTIT